MKTPVPPVFVVEDLDVTVHSSVKAALSCLEPWWVEEKYGHVYDSEGTPLKLGTSKKQVIVLGEDTSGLPRELETILRDFLKEMGESVSNNTSCDLKCLVKACHKFIDRHNR